MFLLDCKQSLFFFRFSKGSARARERRSRETRETRAAIWVPLPSRAISLARGHLRVSRFARRTTEKRETARSLYFYHRRRLLSSLIITQMRQIFENSKMTKLLRCSFQLG